VGYQKSGRVMLRISTSKRSTTGGEDIKADCNLHYGLPEIETCGGVNDRRGMG
jgi:hypothetical protein